MRFDLSTLEDDQPSRSSRSAKKSSDSGPVAGEDFPRSMNEEQDIPEEIADVPLPSPHVIDSGAAVRFRFSAAIQFARIQNGQFEMEFRKSEEPFTCTREVWDTQLRKTNLFEESK